MEWYLVRTKSGKERWVRDQLISHLPEVFLPLLETRAHRWGRIVMTTSALFSGYLFARFNSQQKYFDVRYTPGVQGLVCTGQDPVVVPACAVEEIQRRCVDGLVRIVDKSFDKGDRLLITDGPFRGFEAIFERYLSSADRIAILLSTINSQGPRIVLPSSAVMHVS